MKRAEKRRQEAGDQQRLARWEDLLKEERRGRLEWVKRWLKSENQFQSNRSVDLGDPGLDQRPSKEDKGEERRVEARELGRKDNPRKGSKVKEALADSGWGSAGANSEEELRKEVASLKMAWAKVLRDQQPEKLLLTGEGKESSAEEELRKDVDGLKKKLAKRRKSKEGSVTGEENEQGNPQDKSDAGLREPRATGEGEPEKELSVLKADKSAWSVLAELLTGEEEAEKRREQQMGEVVEKS